MLGAIGDSYTQAWSVSPSYRYDHPAFSWAVGTAKQDGVFSVLERLQSLGAHPIVVDAATSGKKMSDGTRQANKIVAEAAKLPPGSTVFVTFELGTNDLCDDPKTDPATFESQLRSTVSVLRGGLPTGSRILMLSVPDFYHFYVITQADPTAKAKLAEPAQSRNCPPFLGADSPTSLDEARLIQADYDAVLIGVCDEIEATDGATGKLHCASNQSYLSERDFTIADLSTYDYFHPSLHGQGRIAAAAWKAGPWSKAKLPAGYQARGEPLREIAVMAAAAPIAVRNRRPAG
jgi:lysophospholipase L1-like esterase